MNNPTMYLAMEKALKEANVPVPPIAERIFNIIKENPGITGPELDRRLSAIPKGSIASQLFKLKDRGVVIHKPGAPRSGRGVPPLHLYLVDTTTSYADQMAATRPSKVASAAKPSVPLFKEDIVQAPPAPSTKSFDEELATLIDNMTIRQAKALYDKLRRMFA